MIEEKSFAMEILTDYKKANKRLFIIIIILFFIGSILGYRLFKLRSDVGTTTATIEIDGVEQLDNSHIKIGDDIWERLE